MKTLTKTQLSCLAYQTLSGQSPERSQRRTLAATSDFLTVAKRLNGSWGYVAREGVEQPDWSTTSYGAANTLAGLLAPEAEVRFSTWAWRGLTWHLDSGWHLTANQNNLWFHYTGHDLGDLGRGERILYFTLPEAGEVSDLNSLRDFLARACTSYRPELLAFLLDTFFPAGPNPDGGEEVEEVEEAEEVETPTLDPSAHSALETLPEFAGKVLDWEVWQALCLKADSFTAVALPRGHKEAPLTLTREGVRWWVARPGCLPFYSLLVKTESAFLDFRSRLSGTREVEVLVAFAKRSTQAPQEDPSKSVTD